MEFNCPACDTPHAFPEDQIPESGIIVACTHCATHITLDRTGVRGEDATEAIQLPTAEAPRAEQPARLAPPPPSPPAPAAPSPPAPRGSSGERVVDDFIANAAHGMGAKVSSMAESAMGVIESTAFDEMKAESDVPAGLAFPGFKPDASGAWTWRDLPRAFVALFDWRRVAFTTAGLWATLVVFGLLQWVGGWLGSKLGLLGTIFSVLAWATLVAGFALISAVMSYVLHQLVIEQRPSSIKSGIAWVQRTLTSVVGTPLAFAAVIAAAVIIQVLLGLLGRVPFAGPIVWGALSPVNTALMVASGLVAVALLYCLPIYVPVIYNEQTGPVDTLKRLLALYRNNGLSLVGYVLLTGLCIGVAMYLVVLPALTLGGYFMARFVPGAMGENFVLTVGSVPGPLALAPMPGPMGQLMGGGLGEANFGHTLGGILVGIGWNVLPAFLGALAVLVYYNAGCIIYSIVTGRKKVG
ncbi:MAG: zinc-ribbon domain-containing protein [Myxococcales bacterium]|nr:zinc-ribbon domain-containing protein [Myxococcales bacterium]